MNNEYELVLGIEIHIQLNTKHKMFCGCKNDPFYAKNPNIYTCPVCLGLPGGLPVPNETAVEKAQRFSFAVGSNLNNTVIFERKNYNYPDLPKGYQITCPHYPIGTGGEMKFQSGGKELTVRFREIHLEEDTAKSSHKNGEVYIDFNKSGVPLLEIVTEPDFRSIESAVDFCKEIQLIARKLNVSNADMEKGNMRLEANISMRKKGEKDLPNYRVELKNINSYGFMKKALEYEIIRQRKALEKGLVLEQETRGYDEAKGVTFTQRSKEDAQDYRYFPDPDIPVLTFSEERIKGIQDSVGELPSTVRKRLVDNYNISYSNAVILVGDDALLKKVEELIALGLSPKKASNIVINKSEYRKKSAKEIVEILNKEKSEKISSVEDLDKFIEEVILNNEKAVLDYKNGNEATLQFLMGQVMKLTKGKAEPSVLISLLKTRLSS